MSSPFRINPYTDGVVQLDEEARKLLLKKIIFPDNTTQIKHYPPPSFSNALKQFLTPLKQEFGLIYRLLDFLQKDLGYQIDSVVDNLRLSGMLTYMLTALRNTEFLYQPPGRGPSIIETGKETYFGVPLSASVYITTGPLRHYTNIDGLKKITATQKLLAGYVPYEEAWGYVPKDYIGIKVYPDIVGIFFGDLSTPSEKLGLPTGKKCYIDIAFKEEVPLIKFKRNRYQGDIYLLPGPPRTHFSEDPAMLKFVPMEITSNVFGIVGLSVFENDLGILRDANPSLVDGLIEKGLVKLLGGSSVDSSQSAFGTNVLFTDVNIDEVAVKKVEKVAKKVRESGLKVTKEVKRK